MSGPEGQRILVVDDSAVGRQSTRLVLERAGFAVEEAETLHQGRVAVARRPAAVVLDVNLPDGSGMTLAREIRADGRAAAIPIVHTSAVRVRAADQVYGLDAGADAYLVHPIDPSVLTATLRALLRTYAAERRTLGHLHRISALQQFTAALNRATTNGDIVEAVVGHAGPITGANLLCVGILDGAAGHVRLTFDDTVVDGAGHRWRELPAASVAPTTDAIRDGVVVVASRAQIQRRYPLIADDAEAAGVSALLAVPLVDANGLALGSIEMRWTGDDQVIDDGILDTAAVISGMTAQTLQRVALLESVRHARDDLEILRDHAAALAQAVDPLQVAQATAESVRAAFGPDGYGVGLREADQVLLLFSAGVSTGTAHSWQRSPLSKRAPLHEAIRTGMVTELHGHAGRRERFDADAVEAIRAFTSLMYTPLADTSGSVTGAIGMGFNAEHRFTPAELKLMEAIGNQHAQALRRARLHERDIRQRERTEALHVLTASLAIAASPEEMAAAIAHSAHGVARADHAQLGLLDVQAQALTLFHGVGPDARPRDRWPQAPLSALAPVADAINTRQPVLLNSHAEFAEAYPLIVPDAETSGMQSVAVVPIINSEGQPLGTLALTWRDPGMVDVDVVGLMEHVALRCAGAFDRARRKLEQDKAWRRAELVAAVLTAVGGARSVRARAQRLVDMLVPQVADYATIETPGSEQPVLAATHRDPELLPVLRALRNQHARPSDSAKSLSRVAAGEPDLISTIPEGMDAEHALPAGSGLLMRRLSPRSHLAVSLPSGSDPAATLVLTLGLSDPTRRPYDRSDLDFVRQLADRAALSLEGARLLEREHQTALQLQQALLPDALVQHPLLTLAARYRAGDDSLQVGGDWYDTATLLDGRVALAVGDIVGHGLQAAAGMGRLRAGFAALVPDCTTPTQLLIRMDTFATTIPAAHCSTMAVVFLDPATGTMQYASAGHPPILLLDPVGNAGAARYLPDGRSWPLAVEPYPPRTRSVHGQITMDPDATLLLYSDGLVERRTESITAGLDRLFASAQRQRHPDLQRWTDQIVKDLTAGHPIRDDIVLLALHRQPFAPSPDAALRPTNFPGRH